MRYLIALTVVLFTACGGSDSPVAPAPEPQPTAVRITAATVTGVLQDQLTISLKNDGGSGQYRLRVYDNNVSSGRPVGAPPPPPNPRLRCEGSAVLINAGVTNPSLAFACTDVQIAWVVVESQDGTSARWIRTGCYFAPAYGSCPTALQPER
jgi:hypothetical protein